jgi:hypothetical protein
MQEQQRDAFESWAKFLNPRTLKSNLIIASLFLAAYETLRSAIIEHIRGFYTNGFNQNGWIIDTKYQTDVLSRHNSPLRASLLWFREMKVCWMIRISLWWTGSAGIAMNWLANSRDSLRRATLTSTSK